MPKYILSIANAKTTTTTVQST